MHKPTILERVHEMERKRQLEAEALQQKNELEFRADLATQPRSYSANNKSGQTISQPNSVLKEQLKSQQEKKTTRFKYVSVIRIAGVSTMIGLSKSTIYDRLNKKSPRYDPTFPKQIKIGASAVGWLVDEIEAWINACAAKRASDV